MKLETLQKLWKSKNPGGTVMYTNGRGALSQSPVGSGKKFAVTYKADGKIYEYTAATVHALAERFELIPDNSGADYWAESRKAIAAMDAGETFVTTLGLHDTICTILADGKYFVELFRGETACDEYDRAQYVFTGYKLWLSYEEYSQAKYGTKHQ